MKFIFLPWIITATEPHLAEPVRKIEAVETHAGVEITVNGIRSALPVISVSAMPGDQIRLAIPEDARIEVSDGTVSRKADEIGWTAPEAPGLADMVISHRGAETRLNLLVLTPFENGVDDSLNGYRIGMYARPLRDLPSYSVPKGFIDLTAMPDDLHVSPNFQLGQFRCKQQPGHEPTYLLMQPEMLVKLETLLAAANDKGWEADTFFVMSGYRTPFYNAAIGNTTTSSRHLYGDAADIYIDQDRDGQMDDLDGNGRIDKEDARALVKLIDELAAEQPEGWVIGGASAYGSNAAHGPFVHVDTRGYSARW